MSNEFYDNEFEKYLKEKTKQYRIYPSDQVWRNIQNEIHGYRKWPALTFISIFIITALVIGTVLVKPNIQIATVLPNGRDNKNTEKASNITADNKKNFVDHISVENITQQTIKKAIETVKTKRIQQSPVVIARVHSLPDININAAYTKNVSRKQGLIFSDNKTLQPN